MASKKKLKQEILVLRQRLIAVSAEPYSDEAIRIKHFYRAEAALESATWMGNQRPVPERTTVVSVLKGYAI